MTDLFTHDELEDLNWHARKSLWDPDELRAKGEEVLFDIDIRKDEADWNDYVKGPRQVVSDSAQTDWGESRDRGRFCRACGYLIEAHWHTDPRDNEWYACPTESETRARWGDR